MYIKRTASRLLQTSAKFCAFYAYMIWAFETLKTLPSFATAVLTVLFAILVWEVLAWGFVPNLGRLAQLAAYEFAVTIAVGLMATTLSLSEWERRAEGGGQGVLLWLGCAAYAYFLVERTPERRAPHSRA